jgi:hypothetical protein
MTTNIHTKFYGHRRTLSYVNFAVTSQVRTAAMSMLLTTERVQ